MANPFFNADGSPAQSSQGSSAVMRTEFANIAAAFDKMPLLTANTAVVVNGAGTGLTNTAGAFALGGNFTTTGAFSTSFTQQANVTLILPAVGGTLATLGGTETLTNKTLAAPTVTGALSVVDGFGNVAQAVKGTQMGYTGSQYSAIQIGTVGAARVLALNVNPASVIGGSFTGNGTEVALASGAAFILPNAAGNDWVKPLSFNNDGCVLIGRNQNLSAADPQAVITGSGYLLQISLDGTGCYIGQNSNARILNIFSGSSAGAGVSLTPGATSWSGYSERYKKTDFEPIVGALDIINSHTLELGRYKTDDELRRLRPFIFFEDAVDFWPYAAAVSPDSVGTVAKEEYIPLVMQGIKDLIAENTDLKTSVAALTTRLAALEAE